MPVLEAEALAIKWALSVSATLLRAPAWEGKPSAGTVTAQQAGPERRKVERGLVWSRQWGPFPGLATNQLI